LIIERYMSDKNLEKMKTDFRFLIKKVVGSKGELLLDLRTDYFNVYHRGNSLAKVVFRADGRYDVGIHQKFLDDTSVAIDPRFEAHRVEKADDNYCLFRLSASLLHPFFQQKHLDQFMARIKKVNYGEEITFEQQIISDNLDREDLIIIDRQITDKRMRNRMDMLALKQVEGNSNRYKFLVIEVKLGRNEELSEGVAQQLETYVDHIRNNFKDFKKCYETQYMQKKSLELFKAPLHESIDVINEVDGCVLVVGYSGPAQDKIEKLKSKHPDIQVEERNLRL